MPFQTEAKLVLAFKKHIKQQANEVAISIRIEKMTKAARLINIAAEYDKISGRGCNILRGYILKKLFKGYTPRSGCAVEEIFRELKVRQEKKHEGNGSLDINKINP